MLACRLCLAFGVQDPEQWLEECPRRVLNVWRAFAIADGWGMQRRQAAANAIATKRLLAFKYAGDSRKDAIAEFDELVEKHLPLDLRFGEVEQEPISENVLHLMDRGGGNVLKTPTHSIEIEIDPWQRQ